ncbi:hypothetical protein ACRTDO_09790 [Vibrio furnissii]|uniref:hypothetical protein n=1 Tax=Vibrio furnissii TaxID=29494 RepID=UPI003D7D601D
MIYTKQLKDSLVNVRNNIENGDHEAALAQLELADMYAEHHKFNDWRVTPAIQHIAKKLGITEPQAIEEILFYGFYEAGRIVAGSSFDILEQMMKQRKLETIQMMMPYLGVAKMSAREESEALDRINAEKRRG